MKKFLICVGSLLCVLIVVAVVLVSILASRYEKVNFDIGSPTNIYYYDKSYTMTEIERDSSSFDDIILDLKKSMKISKLSQMIRNDSFKKNARIGNEDQSWKSSLKEENLCLQLFYDSKQIAIIYDGNDTKQIEYNYLMIILNGTSNLDDHVIYYANSSASSPSSVVFESIPILITLNEKNVELDIEKHKNEV